MSADEFEDDNPPSSKRVRFTTDDGSSEATSEDMGHELGEEEADTVESSRTRANNPTQSRNGALGSSIFKYSVKEPRHGRKVIEIEATGRRQSAPERGLSDNPRKVVTSKWDPFQQGANEHVLILRDKMGTDSFLNGDPKLEAISKNLNELDSHIKSFIFDWYDFDEPVHLHGRPFADERPLEFLEREANTELKHYVTCLSSGGPTGVDGWETLFSNKDSREAVMYGVIQKTLEEHVFEELLFGASKEQKRCLEQQEANYAGKDGFERTRLRAEYIRKVLRSRNWKGALRHPPYYWTQIEEITLRIFALINPLLLLNTKIVGLEQIEHEAEREESSTEAQGQEENGRKAELGRLLMDLRAIVKTAAMASLTLRLCTDTTFYFQPAFKNTVFDPNAMQSWDFDFIWDGDPQNQENDLSEAYRAAHWNDEPVIQVICSPAVVMFKKGGPPEAERPGERGLRVKTLRKALVSLRWGTHRAVPPKPDDGYLEFEEALSLAREKYSERDATYTEMEQEAVLPQRHQAAAEERRTRGTGRVGKKPQTRSCIMS